MLLTTLVSSLRSSSTRGDALSGNIYLLNIPGGVFLFYGPN